MPDDQNTAQNPISEENSTPASPQKPTEHALENTAHSEPADAPPEAPEATRDDFPVKSNDIPPSDSTLTEQENEPKTEEKQASSDAEALADRENKASPEPISEPKQASETETAQIPVNEPLEESKSEAEIPEQELKEEKPRISYLKSQKLGELLILARNATQFRKRKKLDRIMSLFLQQSKITNDEVEKFLHVSDATATRYLSILEKENKIKQVGKTGKAVFYSKI